jgi:hypothetical protein
MLATAVIIALAGIERTSQSQTPPEPPRRIVVSIYNSETAANDAADAVRLAADQRQVALDAHLLVVKGDDGKVKASDRRARGTRSGQAVAAIGGLMGGGGSVGVGATATTASEYLTSNLVSMPKDLVETLRVSLSPGDAAVISSVDEKGAAEATRLQAEGAERVLTHDMPTVLAQPAARPAPTPPPFPYSLIIPSTIP